MKCFYPLKGYRARTLNENGKRGVVFNAKDGYADMPVTLPCGRCTGCRLEHSRQWAIRCVHEAQMHEENSFLTLTYNKENLPEDNSLEKEAISKFIRALRRKLERKYGEENAPKIRYFACGEYGEQKNRPHYHVILFGYSFPDRELHTISNGNPLYKSKLLEEVWKKGYCYIGEVTFESAAYVARYVMKKWKKDSREEETEVNMANAVVDRETGEIYEITPEFVRMSRKPGIASEWLKKFEKDTDKDFITVNGVVMSLPKYYDRLLEEKKPTQMLKRKQHRIERYQKKQEKDGRHELDIARAKEKIVKQKIGLLKRGFEECNQ